MRTRSELTCLFFIRNHIGEIAMNDIKRNSTTKSSIESSSRAPLVSGVEPVGVTSSNQMETKGRKFNALFHGAYARDVILPGDSEVEFNQLYDGIKGDWNPQGRSEDEALLEVVRIIWYRRRAMRVEQKELKESSLVAELGCSLVSWPELLDEIELDQTSSKALEAAEKTQIVLQSVSQNIALLPKPIPTGYWSEGIEAARKQLQELQDLFNDSILPSLIAASATMPATEEDFDFAVAERQMRLWARMDPRLDKAMSRLVSLQSQKRLLSEY
jgi:hypothetical protein